MKILAVSHEFPPIGGGGANACYYLLKGFAEKGHEVTLVTANFKDLPTHEFINGVNIHRVNSLRAYQEHCSFKEMLNYLIKAMPLAKKMHKAERFDLCLVFFGIPSGPIGYYLKAKYKLPYIIRFGGGDVPGFQERFTSVYKLIAPAIRCIWDKADARVANSQGLKDMALRFYNKKDFEIICNGVDTSVFRPNEKKSKSNTFRILFVSRLIERKGLQYIVPELRKIKEKTGREIKLIVVGDGPYREKLEKMAQDWMVKDLIAFEGQKSKEEIVSYYQNADLFIFPSEKEGMPNVVLEAMSCGLPVLMSPCEGSKELIHDNGYIVDVTDFSQKIVELINSKENLKKMGTKSRQIIEEKFDWTITVSKYLKIFDDILG